MKFGILGNTTKPVIREVTEKLLVYLRGRGIEYAVHEELGQWLNHLQISPPIGKNAMTSESSLPKSCDILIALGGDGTMLTAARIAGASQVPILGVNLGKLGFLADVSIEELHESIEDIITGGYIIEERLALEASEKSAEKSYCALNDIVVDRGSSSRVIEMETYVNGDYLVTYAADGIIITTPTGSTAYSLATGGPIIVPGSAVLAISPIAPHTLTARPVIVPADSLIRMVIGKGSKPVHITADGQIEGFYDTPAEFTVRKAPHMVRLVKGKKRTYFDLLRKKLMWGRDVRVGNNRPAQ